MHSFSKRSLTCLSLLLSCVLIVAGCTPQSAPPGPRTQGLEQQGLDGRLRTAAKNERWQPVIGDLPNKPPKEKKELPSKRTRYSSRFLNPDGSFTEEIYTEPQYYTDPADKKLKKIDNTVSLKKNRFENEAGDMKVRFAPSSADAELLRVESGQHSVTLDPAGKANVKGAAKGNKVTYNGLFPKTNAEYLVSGNYVKENLILQDATAPSRFTYEAKLSGLTVAQEQNGEITFRDATKNVIWFLANPVLLDAAGTSSTKAAMKLRTEGNRTLIDLTVDPSYLQDPTTKFPVTLDPTINTWDVMQDTFLSSAQATATYGSHPYLFVGADPTYGTTRSLVSFYLPSLPSDARINSATFSAYQTKANTANSTVEIYRNTADWSNATSWSTAPATQSTPDGTVTANTANAYWTWTITQLVKDWYNGVLSNYGFTMRMTHEASSPARVFHSVSAGSNSPRLSINYSVDATGLESFWGYTQDGVNVSNGNYTQQTTDFSLSGYGPELTVTRTYNSRKTWFAGQFGWGWVSNLDTRIVDAGKGPITYIDEDSTRHIFGQRYGGGYEAPAGISFTFAKNADGTYAITRHDNTVLRFGTNGRLTAIVDDKGNTITVAYDANGRLKTLTDPANRVTTFAYGTNGYVSSLTDPAGHVTSYAYDAANNLIKVTDPAAQAITFTYDAEHKMTSFTNMLGSTNTIAYDADDRVTTMNFPITVSGAKQDSIRTMAYNTTSLVTSYTDSDGNRSDYRYNPNGNVIQITGNPTVAAATAVGTYTYDNNNNMTSFVDPNANKSDPTAKYVLTYDANNNQTGVQVPGTETSITEYDARNNVISRKDFSENTTTYGYDPNNNLTAISAPQIATAAKRYDAQGRLLYYTNPLAMIENAAANASFETDANSDGWPDRWARTTEPGKTATYTWATGGRYGNKAVSITNPTGWAVIQSDALVPYTAGDRYVVSGYIKTAATTSPALVKIEFLKADGSYIGQQISSKLTGTHDWTRLQTVVENAPAGTAKLRVSAGMDPGTGTATFDGMQLEKAEVLSPFNLAENAGFERDDNGDNLPDGWAGNGLTAADVLDTSTAISGTRSFTLTGEAGKNKSLYQRIPLNGDANTLLTLSGWARQSGANPSGGVFVLQAALNYTDGTTDWSNANDFDKSLAGWQHAAVRVTPKKAFSSVDLYYQYNNQTGTASFDAARLELGNSFSTHDWDAYGNLTRYTTPQGTYTSYTYDVLGNKTSMTTGTNRTTSYLYDARSLLTQATDPLQGKTVYGYDAAGRLTSITDPSDNATRFTYDEWGNLRTKTDPLGNVITYERNTTGNESRESYPNGSSVAFEYNESRERTRVLYNNAAQYTMTYDPYGNVATHTDANGQTIEFAYNTNTYRTQEKRGSTTVKYGYNPNGQPSSIDVIAGTTVSTGYTYNSFKQLLTIARNGTNQARFVYDDQGNPISTIRVNGVITAREYDTADRIRSYKTYAPSGSLLESGTYTYDANNSITGIATNGGNIAYTYDALDRLTRETLADGTVIDYVYDANGNRTRKTVTKGGTATVTDYTYDAANQLVTAGDKTYVNDKNGNRTGDGSKTYTYDAWNRLVGVKDAAGKSLATYTYDNFGRRISATTASGTVQFLYDLHEKTPNSVAEVDANNAIVAEYTFDSFGNPVTMTRGGATYYYLLNGHGDVTALTDANGAVVASYTYDAYGNVLSQTGALANANPYRYAGYRYDAETGLYYLRARYYDPASGRFMTRDTEQGDLQAPETQNEYVYATDNPVKYTDPTGHFRYWGNWCGPKWGHDGEVKNHLDRICHIHDKCYGKRGYFACSCDCEATKSALKYYWRMWWKEKIAANGFTNWFCKGNCKWFK